LKGKIKKKNQIKKKNPKQKIKIKKMRAKLDKNKNQDCGSKNEIENKLKF
jgi:hypothetical protein